jgi:histidine phosphotransferase ChpT
MTVVTLDAMDLAALLCSRVCHDVISPVGAIVNGLEVLEDENDASMREFAFDLIKKSARQASARLQFCRIAFGAAGSAGAMIDIGDAEQVAKGFLNDDKLSLTWNAPRLLMPKNQVKLLLNLLLTATNAIPRGGVIAATVTMDGDKPTFSIDATGSHSRIPVNAVALIEAKPESGVVDAHGIQAYYTGLIARASGMTVSFAHDGDKVTITSTQSSEAPAVAEPESA